MRISDWSSDVCSSDLRNAVLDGVLDPTRTIQIGIRGSAEYLWEFSFDSGMTVIHAEEVPALGIAKVVEKALAVVGDGPTSVSFDIDGIYPAFSPGTGPPESTEQRRVGKACVRPCSFRCAPYTFKKN